MATEIRVPTLGESVTEATIGKWFGASDANLDTVFPNLRNFPRDLGFLKAG